MNIAGNDKTLNSLLDLGIHGYFPLFHPDWFKDMDELREKKLSKTDRNAAKTILKRIMKHKGIERKKIVLLSLKDMDRKLFMKAFLDLVENRILDEKPELH